MQERNLNGDFKKGRNKFHPLSLKYLNEMAYGVQKDLGKVLMKGKKRNNTSGGGINGSSGIIEKNKEVLCM